ncbi:uncharacterized protein LOC144860958 isoform X1 [Branchiostoma floridae x Branchiostoma japonicum]
MHKPIRAFLIAFALCCYLFTIFINIISSNLGLELENYKFFTRRALSKDIDTIRDWFANSIGNTTAQFQFDFTPAGWVFTLWAVIFFWNLIWHLYALTTICRRYKHEYVYVFPNALPTPFWVAWIINLGLNIGWQFLYDGRHMIPAAVFMALIVISLIVCLATTYFRTCRDGAWMKDNMPGDLYAVRLLCHNGLGIYITFTTVLFFLNLGICLVYWGSKLNQVDVTTGLFSGLAFLMLVWFVLENFTPLEPYCRYTITIWPTLIVVLTAIFIHYRKLENGTTPDNFWNKDDRNDIYNAVLLGLACLFCLLRFIIVLINHRRKPIDYGTDDRYPDDQEEFAMVNTKRFERQRFSRVA